MKSVHFLIIGFLMGILFFSCKEQKLTGENDLLKKKFTLFSPEYAKNFEIRDYGEFQLILIHNPWSKEKSELQKIIVSSDKSILSVFSSDFVRIKTPVKRVAIQSVSNIGFFNSLRSTNLIYGIADPYLIYNPELAQAYKEGKIQNIGTSMNISLEKVLAGNYDVFVATAYSGNDKFELLQKSGQGYIFNLDWLEAHPLGRAEWVKCIGLLSGKFNEANNLFDSIRNEYQRIKAEAANRTEKPDILVGTSFKGVWYVPGGNSFKSILYKDAGANYYWKNDSNTGSLPFSFEKVFSRQKSANIWIDVACKTKRELEQMDERYKMFDAFTKSEIYTYYKYVNDKGANLYWEEGVCRPEKVLSDLSRIFNKSEKYIPDNLNYYILVP